MDEDLFLGNDDLDYSLRLREAGFTLKVATDVFVFHQGQHSFNQLESDEKARLMQDSLDRFYSKLEKKFGEGKVPSSTELWGLDILGVPSKRKKVKHPKPLLKPVGNLSQFKGKRVALVYDNRVRPDTTGEYCKRALQGLCKVTHVLPDELNRLEETAFDLYLFIDDGLDYPIPFQYRPNAWWVIDTHLQYEKDLQKARLFDYVFAAQRDGAEKLRRDGIPHVFWLPLAADPSIHKKMNRPKKYDVAFVGHFAPGPRNELLAVIRKNFENVFIGQKFFTEMAQIYSESRIVFNRSLRNDVNMRVFEAVASGSLLVTNDLLSNGQNALFVPEKHFVVYRNEKELLEKIHYYLQNARERENIARAGRKHVLVWHTYKNRMAALLEQVLRLEQNAALSVPTKRASIVILTYNGLEYTKQCIQSIRENTRAPYELIVVDNGSTDGTREYLKSLDDVTVILTEQNLGFAAGNNKGIQASRGDYIVLLNNDTVVTEGWLCRLVQAAELSPEVGMAGPRSNYVQNPFQQVDEVPYQNMAEMQNFARHFAQKNQRRYFLTTKLVGFCLLLKREVVEKVGLLDESFGIGNFEDDDYCVRTRKAGYFLAIAGDAFVHHFGNRAFRENKISYEKMIQTNLAKFKEKWKNELEFRGEEYYLKEDLQFFAEEENRAGERLFATGDVQAAEERFQKALEWEPKNDRAWNNLGVVYWQERKFREAAEAFQKALTLNEKNEDAWKNWQALCKENGECLQLIRWAQEIPAGASSEKRLYEAGKLLIEMNRVPEAENLFHQIKEKNPESPEADIGLALIAWENGKLNEALDKMEAVSRRAPNHRELVLQYALMAFQIGQQNEAIALLNDFIQNKPDAELQQVLAFLKETQQKQQEKYVVSEEVHA